MPVPLDEGAPPLREGVASDAPADPLVPPEVVVELRLPAEGIVDPVELLSRSDEQLDAPRSVAPINRAIAKDFFNGASQMAAGKNERQVGHGRSTSPRTTGSAMSVAEGCECMQAR